MGESEPNLAAIVQRVTKLEELISHQQHLIEQLNEVVLGLRLEFSSMQRKFDEQQARLKTLTAQASFIEDDPDERPPHY